MAEVIRSTSRVQFCDAGLRPGLRLWRALSQAVEELGHAEEVLAGVIEVDDLDSPGECLSALLLEPIRLFAVPEPAPHLRRVVRVADGAAAPDMLLDPSFDPELEVILPAEAPLAAATIGRGSPRASVARG